MKDWIERMNDTWIKWSSAKWAKGLRITSGVVWNLALLFLIILITGGAFVGSVGAGYFASLVNQEELTKEAEMRASIFSYEETSEVYFANNVYLGKLRTDLERRETNLNDVSPFVLDAVYATEDEYFPVHEGIVPKAIFRGLFQDVTNSDNQTGGSTLTQQLVKNQILTNEVSYERKAKEIILAMRLEKFMNKEEILEAYLNIIPYGRNASGRPIAGIETAAEGIFNKKAKDLNLPQAAFIAGIPQAPFAHTPFTVRGELKEDAGLKPGIDRMLTVLFRMKETGYITEEEYNTAIAYDIKKDFRSPEQLPQERYPFLTYELERQAKEIIAGMLAEKDNIDPERLQDETSLSDKYLILADRAMRTNGYRIHSTIHKDLYDAHQKVKDEYKNYGPSIKVEKYNKETDKMEWVEEPVQVGSVLMENSTGRILSFIGGRDYYTEALNHATQAYRQNGSTMKPLLVYAPAIEYGVIGPGSPVADVQFQIIDGAGNKYAPKNFINNQELGIIPARQALASSQNLAAIRLYNEIIDKRPAEFLSKMGFSRLINTDYTNLSTAIGGMTNGVSLKENTDAFATLANGGKYIAGYMIEKIEDADGNIIFQSKPEPVPVFSEQTAYLTTDMLRDVLSEGTGTRANRELNFNGDFAAKTGTTNDAHDVWFMGYNPSVTLGVWLGYDEPTNLNIANGTYYQPSTRVNMLWARLMNKSHEVTPELIKADLDFKAPKGIVTRSFCAISGLAPSSACSNAGLVTSDLFNSNIFVPQKADDSFISSSYVMINGKRFRALPSTPAEFVVEGGVGVNKDFIDRMLGEFGGDASKLFPQKSSFANRVISEDTFVADGASPGPVSASLTGNTLSWSNSGSNDVVGYRVFRRSSGGNSLLASINEASANSYQVSGPGEYFIVAIDITGNQSPASNTAQVAAPKPDSVPDTKPETKPETKPSTPPTGGSTTPTPPSTPPPTEGGVDEETPPADGGEDSNA